jgi:hypothetical protein
MVQTPKKKQYALSTQIQKSLFESQTKENKIKITNQTKKKKTKISHIHELSYSEFFTYS